MRWRFYLIDRNDLKTQVEEPVGWDAFTVKIKRHDQRHGTFRELQGNQFEFIDDGADLLREEYETYGVRGQYKLLVEGNCSNSWEEAYLGKVGFDAYKFTCDKGCKVKVDLDQLGPIVDLINRFDQKVDLSNPLCFDRVTSLATYDNLTRDILLPSKAILLRAIAKNTIAQEYVISDDSGWFPVSSTGALQGAISIPFNNIEVNSIKDFSANAVMDYFNYSNDHEPMPETIYNNPAQDLNCTGEQFTIEYRIKGRYKNLVSGSGDHALSLVCKSGSGDFMGSTGMAILQSTFIHGAPNNNVLTYDFDITLTTTTTLPAGQKLYIGFILGYTKFTSYSEDVRIEIDPETYFKASMISKCDPSAARYYMINETASRVIESITNNALKLNSDYYGRTDSEPYSKGSNGCGALKAVSMGLDIRKAKLADGSDPKLFLSMEDIFNALSAIENIGLGISGSDVRLEPWTYFYKDDVIFYARNIDKLDKQVQIGEVWSTFSTGYDKWEAEDYNGLDEFLTKRNFRTALSEVKNDLQKLCKWIASGYAHEVTRRKQNDSKDWRYDNDVFVLCLDDRLKTEGVFASSTNSVKVTWPIQEFNIGDTIQITGTTSNNGTFTVTNVTAIGFHFRVFVSGSFVNETAPNAVFKNLTKGIYTTEIDNITSAANILDPATVYNFRISPVRNALHWFNRIAACYRNITNSDELIFMDGDGNYLAEGDLTDTTGCKLEATTLAENENISTDTFADAANALPINQAERVKFTYPVSITEFNQIKANPEGLIYYQCASEKGYGWIDELEYAPEQGTAKFSLIPKVAS